MSSNNFSPQSFGQAQQQFQSQQGRTITTPGQSGSSLDTISGSITSKNSFSPASEANSTPQQAQKIADAFIKSLIEFSQRRGTPLSTCPPIAGRPVNFYSLYAAVKNYGGAELVSQRQHWPLVTRLLEIDLDMASEIQAIYMKFVHPFVQTVSSHKLQQHQMSQAVDTPNTHQKQDSEQFVYQQHLQEQQQNLQRKMQNLSENERLPPSSSTETSKIIQQPTTTSELQRGLEEKPANSSHTQLKSGPILKPRPLVRIPMLNERYTPKKRKIEFKGGYDVHVLSRIGKDVESLSPEFPLFQELGTVNIHAITLALKSQIPGEVRQALDKLALVSSNPSQNIILSESPGLVNALGTVGLDLLENLRSEKATNTVSTTSGNSNVEEEEEEETDLISSVFNAYHTWDSSEQDVVFHVDSLTGDPVTDVLDQKAVSRLEKIIQDDDTDFNNEVDTPMPTTNFSEVGSGSDYFGFTPYLDLLELCKDELDSLHQKKCACTNSFWKEILLDRLICVTMILRNLAFTEQNQTLLVEEPAVMKFVFFLIRSLAEKPDLIPLKRRQLSIHKDIVTLLSHIGLHVSLPTAADSFSVLLLLLSFSSDPDPFCKKDLSKSELEGEKIFFREYDPSTHRYLACAVDALAKLIPRDPPNRTFFKEIFLNTCIDDDYLQLLNKHLAGRDIVPFEFLTKVFVLSMSAIPRSDFRVIPKALELRVPLLQQSFLIAENLISMIPAHGYFDDILLTYSSESEKSPTGMTTAVLEAQKSYNVCHWWLESIESFGPTLLRATCALGAIYSKTHTGEEINPFSKITRRAISVLRALAQKSTSFQTSMSNKSISDQAENPISNVVLPSHQTSLGIFPTTEALFGALLTNNMNEEVVSQLCQFGEESSTS